VSRHPAAKLSHSPIHRDLPAIVKRQGKLLWKQERQKKQGVPLSGFVGS
jgi:hypothetical protein